jgi:hypothetical protein
LIPVKGNKNQRLEFQGTLGYPRVLNYFNLLTDRVESSNPAPEVLIAVLKQWLHCIHNVCLSWNRIPITPLDNENFPIFSYMFPIYTPFCHPRACPYVPFPKIGGPLPIPVIVRLKTLRSRVVHRRFGQRICQERGSLAPSEAMRSR